MSAPRPTLALFSLQRPALKELSADLRRLLRDDDRAGLSRTLELGAAFAERLATGERAVDWFLRPDDDAEAAPLFASLRRVAKKRALEQAWKSDEPALEGRLRQFEVLREERAAAELLDKLLDPARMPWFLQRSGATCGWLDDAKRARLAGAMRALRPALTPELVAFSAALDELDGDVVIHDGLG